MEKNGGRTEFVQLVVGVSMSPSFYEGEECGTFSITFLLIGGLCPKNKRGRSVGPLLMTFLLGRTWLLPVSSVNYT